MKRPIDPCPDNVASAQTSPRLRIFFSAIGKQWIILPATLAVATSVGVAAIGLLFYVRDEFSAPPAVVSMFAAVWTATYSISCIALRPISVRLLPRFALIVANGGMAVCIAFILIGNSLPSAFVLYALYGVALSFFWPPVMGWLSAGLEQHALSKVISRYNLSWSTGTIISPFLGGLLYQRGHLLPLVTSMTLFAATALFITGASLYLPRIRRDVHMEDVQKRGILRIPDESSSLRFPARFTLFAAYFGFGIIVNVLPLYLRDRLGMSESSAGLFLLLRGAATTLGFLLLGRFTFWHFRKWWIVAGQLLALSILLLVSFVQAVPVIAAAIALFGATMAAVYNSSVFHGISGARSRAGRMAIHEAILNSGVVVGSAAGGALYEAFSIRATFLAAGALSFVSLIAVLVLISLPAIHRSSRL